MCSPVAQCVACGLVLVWVGKTIFFSWIFPLLPHYYHTHNTSDTKSVGVFPPSNSLRHQLAILQFNSILTRSTWREHQIPQDCSPLQMPIAVQVITCVSDQLAINLRFHDTLLGLNEFANVLIELRETLHSYQLIKWYDEGYIWLARWRIHKVRSGRVLRARASVLIKLGRGWKSPNLE